jgi:hypothetical protein
VKKTLPVALGMLVGCYAVIEYFVPNPAVRSFSASLFEWGGIVAAAAYVIGALNLVQVTWPKIRRREPDWQYKVVLLGSAAIMLAVGLPFGAMLGHRDAGSLANVGSDATAAARGAAIVRLDAPDDVGFTIDGAQTTAQATPQLDVRPGDLVVHAGKRVVGYDAFDVRTQIAAGDVVAITADPAMEWGSTGRFRTWIYDHVFAPCNATMFALLAFFVASAAFRAFRARNVESALLLGSAIIILLARAPIGRAISTRLPALAQWILDVPSNGSRRAIIMGAAVGAIATGLRVILGIERSHLGGDS